MGRKGWGRRGEGGGEEGEEGGGRGEGRGEERGGGGQAPGAETVADDLGRRRGRGASQLGPWRKSPQGWDTALPPLGA